MTARRTRPRHARALREGRGDGRQKFPLAKASAASYADGAEKALGPFAAGNKSVPQPGCR